jgi:hypothetical protein
MGIGTGNHFFWQICAKLSRFLFWIEKLIMVFFRVEPKLSDAEKESFSSAMKLLEEMALFLKPNQSSQLSRYRHLFSIRFSSVPKFQVFFVKI